MVAGMGLVAPVASAVLALAAGFLPVQTAGPAGPPGRAAITTVGPAGGASEITSMASTGPDDAWAVGAVCAEPCTAARVLAVRHWTGRGWVALTPPARLTSSTTFVKDAVVGASSARNVWIFAEVGLATSRTDALHWTGRHWTVLKFAPSSDIVATAVLGRRNVWAFGTSGASGQPYDVRFNGHSWHRVAPPGNPVAVSAVSARDIWAIGPTMKTAADRLDRQSFIAMHWTGHAWHTVTMPRVRVRAGQFVLPGSILALSPENVWEDYSLGRAGTCCTFGGLEHWNGLRWRRVRIPYPVGGIIGLAPDGHCGVWLLVRSGGYFFYHDGKGQWSRRSSPRLVREAVIPEQVSWIPGTRSLWASGSVLRATGGSQGMIWAGLEANHEPARQCPRRGRPARLAGPGPEPPSNSVSSSCPALPGYRGGAGG